MTDLSSSYYNNNGSDGGVFYCYKCELNMENSIVRDNTANNGGFLYGINGYNVNLIDVTIHDVHALNDGGVFYLT